MHTFETAAVISLIDHLSGPLAALSHKVAAEESSMSKRAAAMANAGQHMTYQMTLPLAMAAAAMTKTAVEFSKNENTISGILLGRARTMGLVTAATNEYVASQQAAADKLGEKAYAESGGRMHMAEYGATVAQAIKAGHDAEASASVAINAFHLALAGRIDQHEAADHILNVAQAFGFTSQKIDEAGKVINRTFDDVNPEIKRYTDLMSIMSSNANMTTGQAADAMKLPAPLAHMMGVSPEFIGVMIEAMAEKGTKGSEAAVNLRSFLGAIFAPKSTAVMGLEQGGVDFNKFRTAPGITPEGFKEYARMKNYVITSEQAKAAFTKATKSDGTLDLTELGVNFGESLKHSGKKGTPVAPGTANKAANEYISQHAKDIDVIGLVMAMRKQMAEKHLEGSQLAAFMEKRQIPRSLAYLSGTDDKGVDVFANSARRMFGEDWKAVLDKYIEMHKKSAEKAEAYLAEVAKKATEDNANVRSVEHAKGLEGALNRVGASYEHLVDALYKAGAFEHVAKMLDSLSNALDKLSRANPDTLLKVVDGLALVATLGPALMIGGRITSLALALTKLAPAVEGVAAAAGAVAAPAAGVAATAGGAVAGGSALAAAAPAALGMIAGGLAAVALKEAMGLLVDAGAVDPNNRPGAHAGHWDITRNGRSTSRVWRNDDMFLDPTTNGAPQSATVGALKKWWDDDWSTGGRGSHAAHNASPAETAAIPSIAPTHSALPSFAADPTGGGKIGSLTSELAALKAAPVNVQGDVKGQVDIHSTMTVGPSQWFVTKIDTLDHVVAEVSGKLGKLGETMAGSNAAKGSK